MAIPKPNNVNLRIQSINIEKIIIYNKRVISSREHNKQNFKKSTVIGREMNTHLSVNDKQQ